MSRRGPLKLREFLKRLKPYGVEVLSKRGKGSERILVQEDPPGSGKGPQYPIKDHGPGTTIHLPVIEACLRRFNITDFWK